MALYANVIIDISHEKLDKTFQYKVPQELRDNLAVGMQVEVPFGNGNRRNTGYVLELTDEPEYDITKLKEIVGVAQGGIPIESQLIALAGWMRENYGATMNQALKTVLPVKQKTKVKKQRLVRLSLDRDEAQERLALFQKKHHLARARLLSSLIEQNPLPYEAVTGKLHITASVIRAMEGLGILTVEEKRAYRSPLGEMKQGGGRVVLNEGQREVVARVWEDFFRGMRKTYLLRGVTGSGKTAVYIEIIEKLVSTGRQAIVLIPEIALTYQTVLRFFQRFGERVSILNSKMSKGERYDQFERARNGACT